MRPRPTTCSGRRSASRSATIPPIELPTSTTGRPSTRWMKRLSRAALWWTEVDLPSDGLRPKPARSRATTRRPRASSGPMPTQLRCEPPSPCTSTTGWWGVVLVAAVRTAEVDVVQRPVEVDGATGAAPRRGEVEGLPGGRGST